jgi:hypothetical protein
MEKMTESSSQIRDDLFDAIKFGPGNKPGRDLGKHLGKPWVFKWIFQKAWKRFSTAIACADWSIKQCSKSLFGDDAEWVNINHGVRQAMGRCLRYFVDHGMLPLRVINPDATGTKYYALIEA